jgi:hypothetical protein
MSSPLFREAISDEKKAADEFTEVSLNLFPDSASIKIGHKEVKATK